MRRKMENMSENNSYNNNIDFDFDYESMIIYPIPNLFYLQKLTLIGVYS